MGRGCARVPLHVHVRHATSRALRGYGRWVAALPWAFVLLPLGLMAGLGGGIVRLRRTDIADRENIPRDSRAVQDQAVVGRLFPDRTGHAYDALALNEDQIMGSLIFIAKNNASIYDDDVMAEINDVIADVKANVTAVVGAEALLFDDVCGRQRKECVVTGERLLTPQFNAMRNMDILTYPKWTLPTTGDVVDLSFALADADRQLKRVGVARVTFKLRHDLGALVFAWEDAFVDFLKNRSGNNTEIVFAVSRSLEIESQDAFRADLLFLWLAVGAIAFLCCVVTWGGDMVSTRALLVVVGVASPALGMLGGFGLLSLCGVKVVGMVFTVPILLLVVGVTDWSLLMTSWSRRLGDDDEDDVGERLGWCMADVVPTVTVTSLTLTLVLCVTFTSPFLSLASLGLYAGVSVLFYYLCFITFGMGCLALHGRRVMTSRHVLAPCVTCQSRDQLRKAGRSGFAVFTLGGSVPVEVYGDQGLLERAGRLLMVKVVGSVIARVVVVVVYLAVLGTSVYGLFNLKMGVDNLNVAPESSYLHDYLRADAAFFGFSVPVVMVMGEGVRYDRTTVGLMDDLLSKARQDPGIDADFVRCWLTDFNRTFVFNHTDVQNQTSLLNRTRVSNQTDLSQSGAYNESEISNQTDVFNSVSSETPPDMDIFPIQAVREFLNESTRFQGDVVLDEAGGKILASRCYVFTEKSSDQAALTGLMQRMRWLASEAGFSVFAYHPAFLSYDRRLAVVPALYMIMGPGLGILALLTVLAFPDLVTVVAVLCNMMSMAMGSYGVMGLLHVPVTYLSLPVMLLTAVLAFHLSLSVPAAYLHSHHASKARNAADAAARAASPMLLSLLSVIVGLLPLAVTQSYSLTVLWRVVLPTLALSAFHAAVFMPTLLTIIGHEKSQAEKDKDRELGDPISSPDTDTDSGAQHRAPREKAGHDNAGLEMGEGRTQARQKTWPKYFTSAHNTMVAASNPTLDEGSTKRGKSRPGSSALPPYYQNSLFGNGRNSVTSDHYDYVGHAASSDDVAGSGVRDRAANVYKGTPYEMWPRFSRRRSRNDAYDTPCVLPLSWRAINWRQPSQFLNNDPDYINLAGLGPGRAKPKLRAQSSEPVKETTEPGGRRSRRERRAQSGKGASRGGKGDEGEARPAEDLVTSLDQLYEDVGQPDQDRPPVSCEGIHHVACTLSTHGGLAATQGYVTENFRDVAS